MIAGLRDETARLAAAVETIRSQVDAAEAALLARARSSPTSHLTRTHVLETEEIR